MISSPYIPKPATSGGFIEKIKTGSLFVGGNIYAYKVLGRVTQHLFENREQLNHELEKQADTNRQLEFEVTERERAENRLIVMNEQLEQRVLDRTRELAAAYENLQTQQTTILRQDRMACIGQLAASVAHDINNPIGFVYGNLEVLKSYWAKLTTFIKEQDAALSCVATPELAKQVADQRRTLKVDYLLEEFNAVIAESLEGTERVNRTVLNLKGFSRLDLVDPIVKTKNSRV